MFVQVKETNDTDVIRIDQQPELAKARRHLALMFMYRFQYDKAFACFEPLRVAGSVEGGLYQAVCRLFDGRASEAEKILDAVLEEHNNYYALAYRCLARFRLGRLADAQTDLENAFAMAPGHWLGCTIRGVMELKSGDLVSARKSFERSMPKNFLPLKLGQAAARLGMGEDPGVLRSEAEKSDIQHFFFALLGPEGKALRDKLEVVTLVDIPTGWL